MTVGGCQLNMIVGSGASVNIVDKEEEEPYSLHIVTNGKETLYTCFTSTFGNHQTSCKVSVSNHATGAEFCVISGKGEPLLGKIAAIMFGVLKIGIVMVSVKLGSQNSGEVL